MKVQAIQSSHLSPLLASRQLATFRSGGPGGVTPEGSDAAMTSTAATEWTSPLRAIERAAQEAAKAAGT